MTSGIKIVSPVDGSAYAERPYAGPSAVSSALAAAREAQAAWAKTAIAERAGICTAFVDEMLAMAGDIVPELAWQMGRPVRFGHGELNGFEERARHMIAIAGEALQPVTPAPKPGFERYIERLPLGVVFTIAPWNFPYLTAVNSIVPALMAGNAVILKHAAQTTLAGERFQMAFAAAGLPDGLFRHLVLSHGQTAELISSGGADLVCFTGSVPGGKAMEEAAAGRFIGLGLELGGKDPAYVRDDADLAYAVEGLADGAFFNSGQSCCGIERIYVAERLFDDFVDGFADLTRQYVLGDPLDEATTLGPMVRPEAADFVRGQYEAALRAGATAHVDPADFAREADKSAYCAPRVLTSVSHQMAVMTEESFGPIVGIMKVRDDGEAVQLMNDSAFGLTASVWTNDVAAAKALGAELQAGTVFMNRCDYLDPALAWTGVKASGRGVTLSRLGYEAMTRPKSFHLKTDLG